MLVSEQIYLDHCFEFGCTGQRDVAAEKYSGGCILFCTERQVDAVIVGFLTSASHVYCDTSCATVVMHYESGGTSMYFFQCVNVILGMWAPGY